MTYRDHVAMAAAYARDVTANRIPACRYVRLACRRHLDGLKRQPRRDYPYRLDAEAARRVCVFLELLPHVKGKWARNHELLRLEPWQCFIVVSVYGWVRKRDGLRRFRRVYVEVPRKNAKSTLTAGLGLYHLTADGEHGAEVYSGATSEKQAWEVFGPARLMARGTPQLCEAFGVTVGAKNLHILATASKCEPIIGKPGDGASPSFSITDEYHEHTTSEQYDTMVTGMGAREQPIAWVITTAGYDTASPCYHLRQQAIEVLEGLLDWDECFALIYTVDDGDDWAAPETLRKANPNMGVSVSEEFLLSEQRKAITSPRDQAVFKTKHLDIWVTASAPYFNAELWNRLGDAPPTEEFKGEPCIIGLDLASKLDLAFNVRLHHRDLEDGRHYFVYPRCYLPQSRTEAPDCRHYAGWAAAGHLIVTGGDITDYDAIEADVRSDTEAYQVRQLGADPYNATQLLTHLQKVLGPDKVLEVPQTVLRLSEPMKELQALIVDGRIHHDGNPVLAWCVGNVTAQEDRNQNVFPRKERKESKIDGAVAIIIALGLAMLQKGPPTYDIQFVG